MEQILNLIWIALAVGGAASVLPKQRNGRTIVTLLCLAALLFPIISISDDLVADRSFFDAYAAVLVGFILALGLILILRLTVQQHRLRQLSIPFHADPRSPPCA